MDRRSVLRSGIATVAGALVSGAMPGPVSRSGTRVLAEDPGTSPGTSVADRQAGHRLRPSLAAYSFRKELSGEKPAMTLEDFVDLCAREGLDGTELTSYYFRRTDPEYLVSLRRRAHVNGLTISGTPVGNDFCFPPGEKRDEQLRLVSDWIDRVALLGSQTIRVFAGRQKPGMSAEEAQRWCIEGLKLASEQAGRRGILLALENHGGITETAEQLLYLVRSVDSPWLGVNLDTGNFHQDVYRSLERVAPYAVSVQVKVETREGSEPPRDADIPRIVRILRESGYRGFVALEYEAKEPAVEAVPRHLARLREALDE